MSPRVVVVGGGLTGLATAWRLREVAEVVLLEASERLGGQVRTVELGDARVDVGADAFLARQPEGTQLVRDAGLGEALVAPAARQVMLWRGGRLRPLPRATVFGVPSDVRELARSGVLSPSGLARAALEPAVPRRFVPGDRSVADLVGERFGREVAEVLVEPLLGGVYAGRVEDLSAQATIAPVWAAAGEHRSLLRGLAARRAATTSSDGPIFLTLRGGLSTLVDRLGEQLGKRVQLRNRVDALHHDGREWIVDVGGVRQRADHVVLAVPAAVGARLLAPVLPDAARELATVRTASVGVVAFAYDPADAAEVPDLSGVLVPRTAGRLVKAVTVSSRKWPHLAAGNRFIVRASVGRAGETTALDLDEEFADRVDAEIREMLGIRAAAPERRVVRWPDALPQYEVGHLQRVDRLRHALSAADLPGMHVTGASLDGVGLAARAREAAKVASRIAAGPRSGRRARRGVRAG